MPDEMSMTVSGPLGNGEPLDRERTFKRLPDQSAEIASWLLTIPSAHPLWSQYVLSVVHLRPLPTETKPATITRPGSTHELMVFALDRKFGPYTPGKFYEDRDGAAGGWFLQPVNVVVQFGPIEDELARRVAYLCARGCVDGHLFIEPAGIGGAREMWAQMIHNTVEHLVTGGHRAAQA